MSDFDKVFDYLGAFGPFQRQVFILVSAFETPAAWAMLLPVFIGAKPDWWCCSSINAGSELNRSSSPIFSGSSDSLCGGDNYTMHSKTCPSSSLQCDHIVYDNSYTSIITEFDLICEKNYINGLITTLQMVGLVIGATVAGQLADMFGRKKILFITYFSLIVTSLLSAFSNSWLLFAFIRIAVGASIGGLLIVNFILPIEYVGKQWRTFCGCVGLWAVGVMTLPIWAYFIRDWRHLCIATACGSFPLLSLWWFVPESCRWLVTKGRYTEAEQLITKIAERNKKATPDFSLLRSFSKTEADLKNQRRKLSYWHLCVSKKSAFGTFVCMYGWFASSMVYYGLSFYSGSFSGNIYLNVFLSGLVEIPALVFVLIANNRIGRRWTVFILFLLAGFSLMSIMFVDLYAVDKSVPELVMALIGKSAISGGWAAVQIFSAEKFPTLIRNIGVASCAFAARIGGIVAPQIAYLKNFSAPAPFLVFGGISVLCAVLMLCLSETANLPLPDKLTDIDSRSLSMSAEEDVMCDAMEDHPLSVTQESAPSTDAPSKDSLI